MRNVVVTGSEGFIGKNLLEGLKRQEGVVIYTINRESTREQVEEALAAADIIYHLAGVNRTDHVGTYQTGNTGLATDLVSILKKLQRNPRIVYTSTVQAALDNPYGTSKRAAEEVLINFAKEAKAEVLIYRLPNVFGKWCKPYYNSVVATFCHNIARGLDITISDPKRELELVYIDEVVQTFVELLRHPVTPDQIFHAITTTHCITLGDLAATIRQFPAIRQSAILPNFSNRLTKYLYSTYLSHLDRADFQYELQTHRDQRGSLFELIKSESSGQIFVSKSNSGVIRGNHYHNTKVEKFCVIKGMARVSFRNIWEDEAFSYVLSDEKNLVLDIPPGYTHNIENISDGELIVLFWANEIFDPKEPDTYGKQV